MKRVLIFDDDEDILLVMSELLAENFEVHTQTNVNTVLENLEKVQPSVVIMDNWIPDYGGVYATQQIKKNPKYKDVPVIYITANTNIHLVATEAGAEYYLQKPFDIDVFENLVKRAAEQNGSN